MTDNVPTKVSRNELDQPPTAYRFKCLLKDEPEKDILCGFEGSVWVETPVGMGDVMCPHCERQMVPIEGRVIDDTGCYVFDFGEVSSTEFRDSLTPEHKELLEQK